MNRIEQRLTELKEKKEKAFITYITAGLPDLARTKEIIRAQEAAGTDMIELGVPFSDPVADGPVIQRASYQAICGGATLVKIFEAVEELRREGSGMPIVFMMYYNTVLHYGVEAFVKKCREIGVDGVIIPDLPIEEQDEIRQYLTDDTTILIQLISPVSGSRIKTIVDGARGFVYCISAMGVTGQDSGFHKEVRSCLKEVKKHSDIPVMMGFGIREAGDVAPFKNELDGVIVGTHFIELLEQNGFRPEAAAEYCTRFKKELNAL